MDDASSSKEDKPHTGDHLLKSLWNPTPRAFGRYSQLPDGTSQNSSTSRSRVNLIGCLTKDIVQTYKKCNPEVKYSKELTPKRVLTSPSVGVLNDGYDNANSDLILAVNSILVDPKSQRRYIVKEILGHGTFGQVAKCLVSETNNFVAVKIIKNQRAYYQQALFEVSILNALNRKFDPEDRHHIVRILDHFMHQCHLCISFELLYLNLYEIIKIKNYSGLQLKVVQMFSKQILSALILMKDAGIIHCDLKPENIMLNTSVDPIEIKVIDFGSACMEHRTVYSYIQSRYYRSPEVVLGYQYTTAIDMWSFGCIIVELFIGLPLFSGASEFDLLKRMIHILGGQPPDHVLNVATNTNKFFKHVQRPENGEASVGGRSAYQVLTKEEYEAREVKAALIGKEFFKKKKLEEIVIKYWNLKKLPDEVVDECATCLIDFLRGLLQFDPVKRWTPLQASKHPFVTGEPFICPYKPSPETSRVPESQNVKVDHHPGVGHWVATGLSPQVSNINRSPALNGPHFHAAPLSYASSYGSFGSHGSCTDATGFGSSSYESYGDSSIHAPYSPVGPSSFNHRIVNFEASPNARRMTSQLPLRNGRGVSPSRGNFGQMSLGTSPSQSIPNSHVGSPGKYGPTSPARNSGVHGSPLGKIAAISQFNRSLGYPGNFSVQSKESASSPNWQGHQINGASCNYSEGNLQGHGVSPRNVQTRSSGLNSEFSSPVSQNPSGPFAVSSNVCFPPTSDSAYKQPECISLPDPGDWDPNYSDELLLQEDGSDTSSVASEFTNRMRLSNSVVSGAEVGRFNQVCFQTHISSPTSNQRTNVPVQAYLHVEGSPPSTRGTHVGYACPLANPSHLMNQSSQNSPSRFGQQPIQWSNHGQPTHVHGSDWNHLMVRPAPPHFYVLDPHSSGNNTFTNRSLWGQATGHPITSIPPTFHARNDYRRIA